MTEYQIVRFECLRLAMEWRAADCTVGKQYSGEELAELLYRFVTDPPPRKDAA